VKPTLQEVPPVETAWDSEDTARYLKCSLRHVADVRVEDPTFPQPRMVGSLPRWEPSVVRRWVASEDQPAPKVPQRRTKRTAANHV
jgi:predicted DNA-binding transcriptional regulator AlpA